MIRQARLTRQEKEIEKGIVEGKYKSVSKQEFAKIADEVGAYFAQI